MRESSVRKMARVSMLIAAAIALGWVERMIPLENVLPGVKLGLANVVVLVALDRFGTKEAVLVMLLRVLLSGFLFSTPSALIYSLSGGILSLLVMIPALHWKKLSLIGVSVLGATFHNIGQWLAVVAVTQTAGISIYLPVLMLSGLACGFVTGLIAATVLRCLPEQIR